MQEIKTGEAYSLNIDGEALARVLNYYGYIPDACSTEYKIVCPFHNDLNPSMVVDLETGKYFCFGCSESGNAFDFIKRLNPKLNDLQVLRKMYRVMKSKKIQALDFSHRTGKKKVQEQEAYDIAWNYYYGLPEIDWRETKYDDVTNVLNYMSDRGFDPKILNKAGARITFNSAYPIIFPMMDNGVFRGWVCRTNNPDIEKQRKYLYNTGFMRRNTLVGNYGHKDYVVVCEGYMDRLKFVQYGEESVVAILGWKMSKEQEEKIKSNKKIKYIISALDNDECGKKGTEYLKKIFPGQVIRFRYKKGIKDPGQMEKGEFNIMYTKTINLLKQRRLKNEFIRQDQK